MATLYQQDTYFKYTDGGAFTLDGIDYTGFFHIDMDGNAYTGKINNSDSEKLTPKPTFLADIYLNRLEFNNSYKNTEKLETIYTNPLDILNKSDLDRLTDGIDRNNLVTFKSMIIDNYKVYNFDPNDNHFYANKDNRMESFPLSTGLTYLETLSAPAEFDFIDDVVVGTMVLDSDKNFKYICATDTAQYVISGGFIPDTPLAIISQKPLEDPENNYRDKIFGIYYDSVDERISIIDKEFINVYDSRNFMDCNQLFLVDKIRIEIKGLEIDSGVYIWNLTKDGWKDTDAFWTDGGYVTTNARLDLIKFGRNLRTTVSVDNKFLVLYSKYSSDIIQTINLQKFEVGTIKALDVRTVDDLIILLHQREDGFYVLIVDPEDPDKTTNLKIESLKNNMPTYTLKFSDLDSDIFYLYNKNEYQTRHISNPTYPTGRLETGNLLYFEPYRWSEAFERHDVIPRRWDSTRTERNEYTNITASEVVVNDTMYLLLHNVGRLYAIYQPVIERYNNNVNVNINKEFTGVKCSESSIGPFLNSAFSNLINDTLNLYSKSYAVYNIGEFEVDSEPLPEFEFGDGDLYVNGNETINALTIQRILLSIDGVQSNLLQKTK